MNIQYPVSEILRCVDSINDPEKEIYESNDEIFVLRDPLEMKEKIKKVKVKVKVKEKEKTKPLVLKEDDVLPETEKIIKEAESTVPQTSLESSTVQPFQIDEIIKVDNLETNKKETAEDVLMLSEKVNEKESSKYSIEKKNTKNEDSKEIKILNEQVSVLKTHNAMLEHDLNEVFKTIKHKTADKELQSRLELVYKQQKVIKDYENQISNLREQNKFLEQKFDSSPNDITVDLKHDHKSTIDSKEVSQLIGQEKYDEELKIKSKIIHEQQSILGDYQNQVSKLKEENRLLQKNIEINNSKIIAATQIEREKNDNDTKTKEMFGKIKYYQEDNLRLSNEVVQLSNKLENTKQQLKQFENNKTKLMHQLESLNNIISENNIIDTPFSTNIQKIEDKTETNKKISDQEQTVQDTSEKNVGPKRVVNLEGMNEMTKKIFKP